MIYVIVEDEVLPDCETGRWEKTGNQLVEVHTRNPVNGRSNFYRFKETDMGGLKVVVVKKSKGGYTTKIDNPDVDDVPRTVRKKLNEKGFFLNDE